MKADKRRKHRPAGITNQNLRHVRGGDTLVGIPSFQVAHRKEKHGVPPPPSES